MKREEYEAILDKKWKESTEYHARELSAAIREKGKSDIGEIVAEVMLAASEIAISTINLSLEEAGVLKFDD